MSRILGIDPGKSGGLVLLENDRIAARAVMPVLTGKGKPLYDLLLLFRKIAEAKASLVVIEMQKSLPAVAVKEVAYQDPATGFLATREETVALGGSAANWGRGYSQGILEMACVALKLRYVLVAPQTWQAEMLRDTSAKDTKQAALVVAKRLWPDESFLASPKSKKPHEGLVDAALIAEWARRRKI